MKRFFIWCSEHEKLLVFFSLQIFLIVFFAYYNTRMNLNTVVKNETQRITQNANNIGLIKNITVETNVLVKQLIKSDSVQNVQFSHIPQQPLTIENMTKVSSIYNFRTDSSGKRIFHAGIDYAAPKGTPVLAAAAGIIEYSGYDLGYGNNIKIKHFNGYETLYGHLSKINVMIGQYVTKGELIGNVGNTGLVRGKEGYHLHYEVWYMGQKVNPDNFTRL